MTTIEIILIIFGLLSIYNFLLYPVILAILSKIIPVRINPVNMEQPEITFIIAAYNEESLIAGVIKSIRESDYPKNKINIIIGSDGSTDKTNEIIENIANDDAGITLVVLGRGGKNRVLNTIVPMAKTEIILFMDVDVRLNKDTITNLIRYYVNDDIGAVIASQKVVGDGSTVNAGSEGDSIYHKYEEYIRINESIIASNVNSLGYLYSIKKDLFIPIPNDMVCDDLHNIYSVLRSKKRVIFALEAKAYEIRPKSLNNEYHRRIRAVAGGWATIKYHSELLNIFKFGITALFVWSHKIFRWLSPVFMIFLMIFTILTYDVNFNLFLFFIIPQLILYFSSFIGYIFEKMNMNTKIFRIFVFFVSMNYSSLLGLFRFLSRQQNAIWSRDGFKN